MKANWVHIFFVGFRRAILMMLDTVEECIETKPTTAEIRKAYKEK